MTISPEPKSPSVLVTPRLEIRHPDEADRDRFVTLFQNDDFMIFAGTLTEDAAHDRFDRMVANCAHVTFAKQPVIERATGTIIGYTGVDSITIESREWLEYGWRLVPEARGKGFATESSRALLAHASQRFEGDVLAIIDPTNRASANVSRKLGFTFWKQLPVDGDLRDLYLRHITARL